MEKTRGRGFLSISPNLTPLLCSTTGLMLCTLAAFVPTIHHFKVAWSDTAVASVRTGLFSTSVTAIVTEDTLAGRQAHLFANLANNKPVAFAQNLFKTAPQSFNLLPFLMDASVVFSYLAEANQVLHGVLIASLLSLCASLIFSLLFWYTPIVIYRKGSILTIILAGCLMMLGLLAHELALGVSTLAKLTFRQPMSFPVFDLSSGAFLWLMIGLTITFLGLLERSQVPKQFCLDGESLEALAQQRADDFDSRIADEFDPDQLKIEADRLMSRPM